MLSRIWGHTTVSLLADKFTLLHFREQGGKTLKLCMVFEPVLLPEEDILRM